MLSYTLTQKQEMAQDGFKLHLAPFPIMMYRPQSQDDPMAIHKLTDLGNYFHHFPTECNAILKNSPDPCHHQRGSILFVFKPLLGRLHQFL